MADTTTGLTDGQRVTYDGNTYTISHDPASGWPSFQQAPPLPNEPPLWSMVAVLLPGQELTEGMLYTKAHEGTNGWRCDRGHGRGVVVFAGRSWPWASWDDLCGFPGAHIVVLFDSSEYRCTDQYHGADGGKCDTCGMSTTVADGGDRPGSRRRPAAAVSRPRPLRLR